MIPLGYTAAELQLISKRLTLNHAVKVNLFLMDLNHVHLGGLGHTLIDGQVNFDANADITRSLTLSLVDPERTLSFESDSPADGALYVDRMLRVIYTIGVPTLGWVDIPVFTGPVAKMDRSADVVNIECQGKEALAMGAAWKPMTFKRGQFKHAVIEEILRERCGETRFSFPTRSERLAHDLSIGRMTIPWTFCKHLAHTMDEQLFYDGRGVCRLRKIPGTPSYIFRTGNNGSVLSTPTVAYTTDDLRNTVWVKGGVPKGQKKAISKFVVADKSNPLSPVKMGRKKSDGTVVPRHLVEIVEANNVRSEKEALQLGKRKLARLLMQQVNVTMDVAPNPLLEEMDASRLSTDDFEQPFRIVQTALPLVAGQSQSVGYLKRVSVKARRSRRR